MTDAPSAWSEVGARFTALGQTLRTHFEEARSSTTDDPAPPASDPAAAADEALAGDAPSTTTGERGPDPGTAGDTTTTGGGGDEGPEDAVRAALRRLGDAIDGVVTAVGATVSDPKVKHDAKDVGSALSDALTRSFATVSEDLRKAFSKVRGHDSDPEGGPTTTEYGYPTTTEAPPEAPPSSSPER